MLRISWSIFILVSLSGCIQGTTASSPQVSGDLMNLTHQIAVLSNAQSAELVDFETREENSIVKKELRIDLTKPDQFPDNNKIKEIILAIRPNLTESSLFDRYTITEVSPHENGEQTFPSEKILKSGTILAKRL